MLEFPKMEGKISELKVKKLKYCIYSIFVQFAKGVAHDKSTSVLSEL